MQILSIHDTKAEAFSNPFVRPTLGIAIREITDSFSNDELMRNNPIDFSLYQIGTFDPSSGRITPCDPEHVIDIVEFVPKEE